MIHTKDSSTTLQTTVSGDSVRMGIAEGGEAFIVSILTDLYSDPQQAVIREYSTNGSDAHVEVGQTRPIEVTLPTTLAPLFKVRDFGVGLDHAGISQIFAQYGASTKRGTNEQNGMLGLGSKSALTYASQFTVVSVKDGVRLTAAITRTDDGLPTMTILSEEPSDEANGTEVVVPVRSADVTLFHRKAADFYRHWKPGTVLVNGEQPEGVQGHFEVADGLVVVQHRDPYAHGGKIDTVVMGNVAYPANLRTGLSHGYALVAHVPIGSVAFTPSREDLFYNDRTNATIESVRDAFEAALPGAVQRAIEAQATPQEAVSAMVEWGRVLPATAREAAYTYNGKAIPKSIGLAQDDPNPPDGLLPVLTTQRHSRVLGRSSRVRAVACESWPRVVWVYGYDEPSFNATKKKKLNKFTADNGIEGFDLYALMKQKPDTHWLDAGKVINWADVKAVKLPRAERTYNGRIPGSYPGYVNGMYSSSIEANNIDTKLGLFYFKSSYGDALIVDGLNARHPGCTVVLLSENRVPKFERTFPEAVPAYDEIKRQAQKWLAGVSKRDKLALAQHDAGDRRDFALLDASKVDDPRIKDAIVLARADLTTLLEERKLYRRVGVDGTHGDAWTNPLTDYPLFSTRNLNGTESEEHTYLYLNAAYAAA